MSTINTTTSAGQSALHLSLLPDMNRPNVRRRVLLLTCGLVSALSALVAIAQVPAGPRRAAADVARPNALQTSVVSMALPQAVVQPQSTPAPRMQDLMAMVNHAPDAAASAKVEPAATKAADRSAPAEMLQDLKPAPKAAATPAVVAPRKRVVWFEVTAYCPCSKCCGEDAAGVTASGKPISYNRGRFVAADTDVLPFGTKISIPGYHDARTVEVIDRGSAIKGHRIDVYFPNHSTAKEFGRRWIPVTVFEK
jgi:3D (Asp-Asp-Asp) domain-containing protein